jgi:hypothetical protein
MERRINYGGQASKNFTVSKEIMHCPETLRILWCLFDKVARRGSPRIKLQKTPLLWARKRERSVLNNLHIHEQPIYRCSEILRTSVAGGSAKE